MGQVLEEKLQGVAKALGEAAESAAEKTSNLAAGGGLDLSSVGRGAAVRARRGGEDAAAAVKSQVRSRVREAKSGIQGLVDQKEHLAELVPSVADIQEVKTSIRRLKKEAKREGRHLGRTLDEKTGVRRHKTKTKLKGRRATLLLVAAAAIGVVVVRLARRSGLGDSQPARPPIPAPERTAPATSDKQTAEEDRPGPEPDSSDLKPAKRAGSRAKPSGIERGDGSNRAGSAPDSEKVKRGGASG